MIFLVIAFIDSMPNFKHSSVQGLPYRTGPPNRRPPVSVNRSVSHGNRRKPNKFKIQIETAVQSVRTGLPLGKDRLPVGLGGKPTEKAENPTMFLWLSGDELMKILA
jgi:hypothetical protein